MLLNEPYMYDQNTGSIVVITEYISNGGCIVFNGTSYQIYSYEQSFNLVPVNEYYKLQQEEDYLKIPEINHFVETKVKNKTKQVRLSLFDRWYPTKRQYLLDFSNFKSSNISDTTHYFKYNTPNEE